MNVKLKKIRPQKVTFFHPWAHCAKGPDVLIQDWINSTGLLRKSQCTKNIEKFSKAKKFRVILAWYPLWGW